MNRYKFTFKDGTVMCAWGENPIDAAAAAVFSPTARLWAFAAELVDVVVFNDFTLEEAVRTVLNDEVTSHTADFPTVKLVTEAFEAMGADMFTSRAALKKRIEREAHHYAAGEISMIPCIKALRLNIEYNALLGLFEFRYEPGSTCELGLAEAFNICRLLFNSIPMDTAVVRLKANHPVQLTNDIYVIGERGRELLAKAGEIVDLKYDAPEYDGHTAVTLDGRISFPIEDTEFEEIIK